MDLTAKEVRLNRFGLGRQHTIALSESFLRNDKLRHVNLGSNPLVRMIHTCSAEAAMVSQENVTSFSSA